MNTSPLLEARKRLGITLREEASLLGCSASHLSAVERGVARASPEFLTRACDVLGLPEPNAFSLKPGRPRLRDGIAPVRQLFGRRPGRVVPGGPLRQNFQECCWYPRGARLVEELDAWKRPGLFWKAVKYLARQQNGVEQGTMLRLLLPGGDLLEAHPHEAGLSNPVVEAPGCWWVAVKVTWSDRLLLAFPQVTMATKPYQLRRLDFLLAAARPGRKVLVNLEVDGPQHRARQRADKARADELPFPTWRVRADAVWEPRFRKDLLTWVETQLE